MKMYYIYIILGILVLGTSVLKAKNYIYGKDSGTPLKPGTDQKVADYLKAKYTGLAFQNSSLSNVTNSYVKSYDTLAIIGIESGSLLFAGVSPTAIVGDKGKAIGMMQIHKGALTDVNYSIGSNYSMEDLRSPAINIKVGTHYLDMCFRKAVHEKSSNVRILAYRKYNAGIGRAKDNNIIAKKYAEKVNNFRGLL